MASLHGVTAAVVLVLSAASILKFLFFFVLPYDRRRAGLDRSYAGRPYATGVADLVLLLVVLALAAALLAGGAEPIGFLGGVFASVSLRLPPHLWRGRTSGTLNLQSNGHPHRTAAPVRQAPPL